MRHRIAAKLRIHLHGSIRNSHVLTKSYAEKALASIGYFILPPSYAGSP